MRKAIVFIVFLLLAGCSATTTLESTTTINDSSTTLEVTYPQRDYSEFDELKITTPSLQLSQEQETYYIYYYGIDCIACLNIKNEVLSKIELLQNDTVYLVQVAGSRDISEDIPVEYTPTLVEIQNGVVIDLFVGAQSILNVIDQLT